MYNNKFGTFIESKRNDLCLTLRQASKLTGISHSHLRNLENGFDPRNGAVIRVTPDIIKLISEGYEVDYSYLMYLAGYACPPKNVHSKKESLSDVGIALANVLDDMDENYELMLSGEPLNREDWELFKNAIDFAIEFTHKKIKENRLKNKISDKSTNV